MLFMVPIVLSKTTIIYVLSKILCYLYHCMTTIVVQLVKFLMCPVIATGKATFGNPLLVGMCWLEKPASFLPRLELVMPRKVLVTNLHRRRDPSQGSQPLATMGGSWTGRRGADLTTGSRKAVTWVLFVVMDCWMIKNEYRPNAWGFYKLRRCGRSFEQQASAAQGVMWFNATIIKTIEANLHWLKLFIYYH